MTKVLVPPFRQPSDAPAGTSDLPQIILVFSSAATAEYRVAGIPAAARAAHAIAAIAEQDDIRRCSIVVDDAWIPSDALLTECRRLAPHLRLAFAAAPSNDEMLTVRGETFVAALARRQGDPWRENVLPALFDACIKDRVSVASASLSQDAALKQLRRASRDVLAATGKGGDGIVSRYINRPISRAISHQLLRSAAVTPFHASIGTALLGVAMAFALFLGDGTGLIVGALLFQAASIFDGVDGEIARATYRTSELGATLDSVIDAFTNLAFITGVTVNVAMAGDVTSAVAGGIALVTLAAGLLLIGRHASAMGEAMNFDVVKRQLRNGRRTSRLTEFFIHLTMRDFFAAACALMIVAGLTDILLIAFAVIALGWFLVTALVLSRLKRTPFRRDQATPGAMTTVPSPRRAEPCALTPASLAFPQIGTAMRRD
ncbi:MAG: CDP-alcohol phosphatidyltransferase family protein [Sphingomonas sp.]|nr:MAG: CDP-alcohol phosphatidyltransferase family protein [Sphingomonas sp.]